MSPAVARGQQGLTYRFKADTLTGQMWVQGEHSRSELESGEGGTATGRVEIWKDGGRQILILDPVEQTYYDRVAHSEKTGAAGKTTRPVPTIRELSVEQPFVINRVSAISVEMKTLPARERVDAYDCTRSIITFSRRTAAQGDPHDRGRRDGE